MTRPARLIFLANPKTEEGGEHGEVLAQCEDGIPMGWIFLFGGRNYWEPDDHVRAGAASERSRFETPLEVAEARLTNALSSLSASPHLWVWFASLEILRRVLKAKGQKGYLRLDAPWAFDSEKKREKTMAVPAYAENYVNMVNADHVENVPQYVSPLEKLCPFVPRCMPDDAKRAREAGARYKALPEPARAAALLMGVPPEDTAHFVQRVESAYAAEYAKLATLPKYPDVKARISYSSAAVPRNIEVVEAKKEAKQAPNGLVAKILKLVKR